MGYARLLFIKGESQMSTKTAGADENSLVAIFGEHSGAENAIRDLKKSGFDIKRLSIVGRDFQSEDNVVGFYTTGDRMKYWGKMGAFWGGLWGLLVGAAFLIIPGVGPVILAGPVTGWIIGALEGAIFVGGVSVLGAGLVSVGIPRDKVLKYESAVKSGKFLLVLHGTTAEAEKVRNVLEATDAEIIEIHQVPSMPARVA
jgi:hypothetical protein